MFCKLFALEALAAVASLAHAEVVVPDSVARGGGVTVEADTLREVVVKPQRSPVEDAVRRSLKRTPMPPPSFGDVLDKLVPGLNDKITHPFAIKQRKRERRNKRWMKRLEEFERVRTFDDLLREAYDKQMLEDSIARQRAE